MVDAEGVAIVGAASLVAFSANSVDGVGIFAGFVNGETEGGGGEDEDGESNAEDANDDVGGGLIGKVELLPLDFDFFPVVPLLDELLLSAVAAGSGGRCDFMWALRLRTLGKIL